MPILLASASTAAQMFARIDRAQNAWTRGGASIQVSSVTARGASKVQFRLDLDGAGDASLRIKTPAKKGLASTDHGFFLRGNVLVGIDYDAHESIARPSPANGPLGLRLIALLGGVDDAIGFLTLPQIRSRYLDPLKALGGWKVTDQGLSRKTFGGKASFTKLDVDGTGRLTAFHVELPGSRLDWSIRYGPARNAPLPRGYRKVEAFTARPVPPHYANDAAKSVVESMLRAEGGLQSAIVKIDGNATLWIDGSLIRYERGGSGFSYDGKILTIQTPGSAYRGRTSRGAVIDHSAELLAAVDPMVRSILVRTPPYAELFTPDAKVRLVGTMSSGGVACDVISIDTRRYRSSMFVRKKDHLPASIETETLDRKGNSVLQTTRTLTWSAVGAALPKSLFSLHIRRGQTVLPMPKRKITAGATAP